MIISFTSRPTIRTPISRNGSSITRIAGLILLSLAVFLAWQTRWFHSDRDLSRYPVFQLAYFTCKYERITHSKGSSTKQLAFLTLNGRYVMEDGIWKKHFNGPALAAQLSGGGTVRAWAHPDYPRALRGIIGGKVDIPPEWGLRYDQGNMRLGVWVDAFIALIGGCLLFWKRPHRQSLNLIET